MSRRNPLGGTGTGRDNPSMTSPLPQVAIQRLTQDALGHLESFKPLPAPVIPVSPCGWSESLSDISLPLVFDDLVSLMEQVWSALMAGDASQLRASSVALAGRVVSVEHDLWCLAALRPAHCGIVEAMRTAIVGLPRDYLSSIVTGGLPGPPGIRRELEGCYRDLLNTSTGTDEDPYDAAFGVPVGDLRDAWSVPIKVRIIKEYYNRHDELNEILKRLLSIFPVRPTHHVDALLAAVALVGTQRPLTAIKAAVGVHQMIEHGMAADPEGIATPLRDLILRVDKSAANHKSINWTIRMIQEASTDAERATLTLDAYRKMVEGQLRPWAVTLLRMRGRQLGRATELAAVRDQLLADGHGLLALAAAPILRVARNAAAHEDYAWDDERQCLSVGDDAVTVDELEMATKQAYAFMSGAESKWACARAASPELGRLLDSTCLAAGAGPRILGEHHAVSTFGDVGLHVSDYRYERGKFSVELAELPATQILHCCHAVLTASQYLARAERVKVTLAGHQGLPILEVGRSVLDVAWVARESANGLSVGLTPSTFLPLLAAARCAVETPETAAESSAGLAITDIIVAFDEMRGLLQSEAGVGPHVLAEHLVMVTSGLEATMAVLPTTVHQPLQRVLRLARQMAETLQSTDPEEMRNNRLDALASVAHALHSRWPPPPLLLTLERAPIR